jgi:hypothetical protein
MSKHTSTLPVVSILFLLFCTISTGFAQRSTLPGFLKDKQVWDEKLVVVYAPKNQQHLLKEQLNILYPQITTLKKEKIVVVQIPVLLSASNRQYLQQKLRFQEDRLNIWVIDEKGNLRMSSTKLVSSNQIFKVLNIDARPNTVARAQLFPD